jgi:acyl-CoA dehydrogenase
MLLQLTGEQRQLQTMLRRVADERVAPRAADIDRTAEYPQDMFDLLQGLGLYSLPFPEAYGGTGSLVTACLAVEELGRVCYNTAYLLLLQWSTFGGILAAGTEAQKERLLPGLANGTIRASISVTEPHAGSDVAGITTRADRCDGGYRLTGAKAYCTNATVADVFIVAAKTDPSKRHAGISAFIVERGTPGFTIGEPENKLGARGVPSCPLYFDDTFVPESARLGGEGAGFRAIMDAFNHGRPIIGARGLGLAQGAMELAARFVEERQAFGQKVADFQGVQWMIADMAIQIEAARGLVYKAAALADQGTTGKELAMAAAIAKCFATDTAMKVATDAVQLWGSAGISKDNPIERYFRDAKVLQIIEGTNQIQRNLIGRWTLKDLAG